MRNLLSLPVELLTSILSYLDAHDLVNCSASTKYLSGLILNSSKLQYTIALAQSKYLSVVPDGNPYPPYSARLKVLTEREKAWRGLEWRQRRNLKLQPSGSVYEFIGGIYGNGREDDNRVTRSISFLELPTISGAVPSRDARSSKRESISETDGGNHRGRRKQGRKLRTWTHSMGDVSIIDFTMDPSQDLLALVALAPQDSKYMYNLYLRTISTNEPHPKAPMPILSCLERHSTVPPPPELFPVVRVQVSGDLVGLLIREAPDPVGAHLEIWNWENDPSYPCSMSSARGIDDFTFLSHSAFLIVLPLGRFEVYTFPEPLATPPKSTISTCSSSLRGNGSWPPPISSSPSASAKKGCSPTRKYAYDFPELTPGYMYWYISMSCNPAPGYVPSQSGYGVTPFPPPFSTSYHSPSPSTGVESDSEDDETDIAAQNRNGGEGHGVDGGSGPVADAWSSKGNGVVNQQLYYPLPDERIHACCVYVFDPNRAHIYDAGNNTGNPTTTTHHNEASSSTSSNNNTTNGHNNNGGELIGDDLDGDDHRVHSFVFFLNLKSLLDPPEEWFRQPEPIPTSPTGSPGPSPFSTPANQVGPLWKSYSSPGSTTPTAPYPYHLRSGGSSVASSSFSGSGSAVGMAPGYGETSPSAATLESSLNALKRRQEEKELKDTKAALDAHANVNAKKQKKRSGGLSSSLSCEIPYEAPSARSATTNGMSLMPSPSTRGISSPKAMASSSSGPAYPPFPTFSSPYGSSYASTSGTPSGAHTDSNNNMRSSTLSGFSSKSVPSSPISSFSLNGDATLWPLRSPVASPGGFPVPSTTPYLTNNIRQGSSSRQPSTAANGQLTSSSSLGPGVPLGSTVVTPFGSPPASIPRVPTSPIQTRSISSFPPYTGLHSPSQSNNRSSNVITPPPSPHAFMTPAGSTPLTTNSLQYPNQIQYQTQQNNCRSTLSYHQFPWANNRNTGQPIPWEVWGPSNTRWFEECLSTDWQHAVYGLRTAESVGIRELERDQEREQLGVRLWEFEELKRLRTMNVNAYNEKKRLEAEERRFQLKVLTDAALILGGNTDVRGKKPQTEREFLKDREVDINVQAVKIAEMKEKKKKNAKGKGRKVKEELLGGRTESEYVFLGGEEAIQRGTDAKGKQKVDTSASLELNDGEVVLEAAEYMNAHHFPPEEGKSQAETEDFLPDGNSSSDSDFGSDSTLSIEEGEVWTPQTSVNEASTQAPIPSVRPPSHRFLRVRDFNPYAVKLAEAEDEATPLQTLPRMNNIYADMMSSFNLSKGKGKQRDLSPPSPQSSSLSYSYPYSCPVNLGFGSSITSSTSSQSITQPPHDKLGRKDATQAWGKRRVVRGPSVTPVKGVFKKDIISWLPYTEVVSEQMFEVTDVMMDDCRLLLLQRGQMGKLESVEVLIM